ncbi:MAG TPA: terminase small subunit [Mucilaginibacter sp.]|nr:terminase small subunit [Mucilaginibacter sp.]
MPNGILSITRMYPDHLSSKAALRAGIDAYFDLISGDQPADEKSGKDTKPEPATFAGLALFLGFSSLQAFDTYTETGRHADVLKWGKLRVEASYEKKLHQQSAAGAIFALKRMGWNEREEGKPAALNADQPLRVEILNSGPEPAASEKDVVL